MLDKIVHETKYLNEDTDFVKFMSEEDEDRYLINSWRIEGLKEGISKGKDEGIALGIAKEK